MRIYMAGLFAGRGTGTSESVNFKISQGVEYPWLLESYHYYSERMGKEIRRLKKTIFLDSGAFSMFTQGVKVDLPTYAKFVRNNQDIIHVASNLDAIGAGHEQLSYDRQKQLEKLGAKIEPVHHVRDKDEWLHRYMAEGYKYIFLGGMVPESTPHLFEWLDHVWGNILTNPDGTPKVKVHGFGLTTVSLMVRYPWFSVDSTRWLMASRFGGILIDMPLPNGEWDDFIIAFSERSPERVKIQSKHFATLTKPEQERIRARLDELDAWRPHKDPELEAKIGKLTGIKQGYNPEALAEFYGWRDHFNINYFRRMQDRAVKTFQRRQVGLFT